MSHPTTTHIHSEESTFRSYSPSSSKLYAALRRPYHPSVYTALLTQHTSTGGRLDNVLDLGCGPGLATRDLAPHFTYATGLDASPSMISFAATLGLKTASSHSVEFRVSSAEAMEGVEDESVDLITAANAAHWFDLPAFWLRAAQVLRPGGSVAVWTSGEIAAHPDTPNAAAINEAFTRFKEEDMKPYFEQGNFLVQDGYRGLGMPWDAEPPVEGFERSALWRKEWDLEREEFMVGQDVPFTTEMFERMWATSSPVTRWRQAHSGAEGTEGDIVRRLRREVERLLADVGVRDGEAVLKGTSAGVVVIVKKKKGATESV
jgi:SAM-dependent methyltransferase